MRSPDENREYDTVSDDCSIYASEINLNDLKADCENCFGLCCVALCFSASEGFPKDKEAGQPCINLQPEFKCCVHERLMKRGLKGCAAFDCFGAGQKVAKISYGGHSWRDEPETAKQMFGVFLVMRELHELLWYLAEALRFKETHSIQSQLREMYKKTEQLTHLCPKDLLKLDIDHHRTGVNTILVKTSELVRAQAKTEQKLSKGYKKTLGPRADLIGKDLKKTDLKGVNLRGACLIAADLRGNDLNGTDLIGADFRDTDIRGADLSKSLFLTQAQLNTAKGDSETKIPMVLTRPLNWEV